jgi:hypothetical protein
MVSGSGGGSIVRRLPIHFWSDSARPLLMMDPPTVVVVEESSMTLSYGFVKCKLRSAPVLKPSRHKSEIQYHIHTTLRAGNSDWDSAINVGTSDADDLLRYKLVYD